MASTQHLLVGRSEGLSLVVTTTVCWSEEHKAFDGASRGNPGFAGCGAVFIEHDSEKEVGEKMRRRNRWARDCFVPWQSLERVKFCTAGATAPLSFVAWGMGCLK
eukprot:857827-Pelagomonas_calceolata.AAC.2